MVRGTVLVVGVGKKGEEAEMTCWGAGVWRYSRGQNYRAGRVKKMFYKNHHNFFPSKHFAKF